MERKNAIRFADLRIKSLDDSFFQIESEYEESVVGFRIKPLEDLFLRSNVNTKKDSLISK